MASRNIVKFSYFSDTPTLEYTPTVTATTNETATPTNTPTPFNVSKCLSFSFSAMAQADYEKIRSELEPLVGKCVRFYYQRNEFGSTNDYIMGDDLVYAASVKIVTDDETPAETLKPKIFGRVWGIVESPNGEKTPYVLRLRKSESYPEIQLPIEDGGLFSIGLTSERSPGLWKSGVGPTWTSNCYWHD